MRASANALAPAPIDGSRAHELEQGTADTRPRQGLPLE
jgi:hypothetical protein